VAALPLVAEPMASQPSTPPTREVSPLALSNRIQLFTHRKNSDGTVDSICRQCLTTVAIEHLESMLSQREREHVCDLALEALPQCRLHRVR